MEAEASEKESGGREGRGEGKITRGKVTKESHGEQWLEFVLLNRDLLFVFEVVEGSGTVNISLVDFLSLTVLFWRQRRQVGFAFALE